MKKWINRFVSVLLALSMLLAQSQPIIAAALEGEGVRILSADMDTNAGGVSNLEGYYSNEEWEQVYPQGLFVVEYGTYEVAEGGADPENPEDVYLGIVVYRIGGCGLGSTVTYTLTCVSGDGERYPDSAAKLEFAPQQTTAIAKIRIHNDDVRGGDQLLMFSLASATTGVLSGQGTAVIRIVDDEPYVTSKVSLSLSEIITDKSAGGVRVTVKRTENDADCCTLRLTTADGTAVQGVDYEAFSQDMVFLAGQTEQTVTIPLIQSDEVFTDCKYFTLTMTDLRGCEAADGDTLRLNITNVCDPETKKTVSVEDSKADLTVDESGTLTGSSESIINTNDHIDRAALLRTVIGAANGTAVQSLSQPALLAASQEAGYWKPDVVVSPNQFRQAYCTGDDWVYNKAYTDGNDNLMLISTGTYDLSRFYAITPQFSNVSEKLIEQYPNTAFGYLTAGNTFDKGKFPGFVKSSYSDGVEADISHMGEHQIYYLKNYNFQNVLGQNTRTAYPLSNSAGRYPNTTGETGSQQKLFYMIYDDENWDDTNFTMGETILHRAVIPFRQFDMTGEGRISDFEVVFDENNIHLTRVRFDMDGFTWTIMVDESAGGGVGHIPGYSVLKNADNYGFFAGSSLKIAYQPIGGSTSSLPVPQYLYLVDGALRVHNSAMLSGDLEMLDDGSVVACTMNLETLLKQNITTLQSNYYMTAEQAQKHNELLTMGSCITSGYTGKLGLEAALALKPAVTVNFSNIPTLKAAKTKTEGSLETAAEQKERIYGLLKNVVTFLDSDGNRLNVGYSIDLDNCTLQYESVEFDRLAVKPEAAGGGTRVRTNLYDLDYVNFGTYEEISNASCVQIGTGVEFTLFNENTTYIPPHITVNSVGVSSRSNGGFVTEYTANSLAEFLNFEVLHHDTSEAPELTYYTVRFTISDIYVGSTQGGVKAFPVTVVYETTDRQESCDLLSFTFKGGAGMAEAADVQMELLCSDYTDVDQSKVEGVDAAGYKPVLELVDYTTSGYEYVLYIPSYYDYHNSTSKLMNVYSQRLKGADGISFVMKDYDKNDGAEAAVICTVDAADMPYVAPYIEPVELDSEGGSGQSTYFEEQRQFYTYNDQVVAWNAMTYNWDTTGALSILSKILKLRGHETSSKYVGHLGGTGPYVSHNGSQITAGIRLSITKTENIMDDEEAKALTNLFSSDPTKEDMVKGWNTSKLGIVSGSVDGKAVWNYNALTHQYVFSQFTITVSGSMSLSRNIPIPVAYNLIYANFTSKFAFSVASGGTHVLDYVDGDGKPHYKLSWDGLTITPSFSGSIGVGVGAANLLSAEVGGSFALSLSVKLGKETYVGAQQEFDLDSAKGAFDKSYTVEYTGDWKTYKPGEDNAFKYCYGGTLCESAGNGTLVIRATGTAFQLVGVSYKDGGQMKITVTDTNGNVLSNGETAEVSASGSHTELYKTLYYWEKDANYTAADNIEFVVTIENTSGKHVSLDSIRIYNQDYTNRSTIIPAQFNALTMRIAMYIKFCVFGISFSFDPAYLLLSINDSHGKNTLTIGSFGHSETWVMSDAQAQSGVPLLLATQSKTASTTQLGYWNTGEYSDLRTQSLLQGDISNTAKTQTVSYHGNTYTFYTVLDTDGESDSFYRLYCSVDGQPGALLGDDVFVADFHAFIDGNDRLAVAVTGSDSTVKAMYSGTDSKAVMETTDGKTILIDGTDKLKEALLRTCVKLVTVETGSDGSITGSTAVALGSTDDGQLLQDSNPVGAAAGNATCVFYTSASSSEDAGVTSDWTSFNNGDEILNGLLAAMYQGNSRIFCTVSTASGQTVTTQLALHESLTALEDAVITITSMDAVAYGSTVSLVYTVEVDNALLEGQTGTLKQIHYVQATVDSEGRITCSDTVIVDSVFDYDASLSEIFGEGVTELSSKYYNSSTEEIYDSIILRNVQLELAVLTGNGEAVSSDAMAPCLFYQTNSGINCVSYGALQDVLGGASGENAISVLYDGPFDDYVIAVSPEGAISLIYNDTTQTSAYTDTLYLMDYCPEDQRWSKPRQLTYTDVFDEQALENHQSTGSLTLENFSAFVDRDGKVTIALKSGYAPFSYEYGAIGGADANGNRINLEQYYDAVVEVGDGQFVPYVVMPIPDHSSPAARTDVYSITFADRVKDAAVKKLELHDTIFTQGEQISADITVENTGDYMFSAMKVSLYYRNLDNNSRSIVASQTITGQFLSGDSMDTTLSYTVDEGRIPDNTMLGVLITDTTGRITYYDSYTDCYRQNHDDDKTNDLPETYHVINNAAEFYFDGTKVYIDSAGVMHYTIAVGNCGTMDAKEDATVYFRLYSRNEENGSYTKKQTLFGVTVSADQLSTDVIATVSDRYDVSKYLENGELYYAFELYSSEDQYTTANDVLPMQISQQIPEIAVQSLRGLSGNSLPTDGRIVRNLTLGDEFEIDTAVLAQYFNVSDIRVYEIGTSCLSIDHSAQDGTARVKVVALPHNEEGYIKLLISLDGTVINKSLYLHISNRATIDLRESHGDGGWILSEETFAYATNYDLLSAVENGSTLTFDFYGGDLKLYGDRLIDGGGFRIRIADDNGNVVAEDVVSTAAQQDDCGVMLYSREGLAYGHYTVTIEARISQNQRLVLDYARHRIDTDHADTTAYNVVEYVTETLDAPLLSGRNRAAAFTLTFNQPVELAKGAALEDIAVDFAEYEMIDGVLTPTGSTVTFTADRLEGSKLVLTSQLSSAPGTVRVYVLEDGALPAECLVSTDGRTVNPEIPDYNTITYVLKESGIMSVMVADDPTMPNGSVQKSVQVKFMTAPDTARLEGTKLLYTTNDPDGTERSVEFRFAGMTEDPRVAVYRADELTLQTQELTKLFRYQKGIVLNRNNYVLVTAEGDYLENDITTVLKDTSVLDIAYTKLQAEQARVSISRGQVQVCVTYPEMVSAGNADARVQVRRTLTDNATGEAVQTLLTLPLTALEEDGTVLVFASGEMEALPAGMTATYQLLSETIEYGEGEQYITRSVDGIAVNPALPEANTLTCGTDAQITRVQPFVNENGMLAARVYFSTLMDASTMTDTVLDMKIQVTEYTKEYTETVRLAYQSCRTEAGRTVAVYMGQTPAAFDYEQIVKTCVAPDQLTVPAGEYLLTAEGLVCGSGVLDEQRLTLRRQQAADTQIQLVPNDSHGYDVVMTVQFDGPVQAATMTNVYALVRMCSGEETEDVHLMLSKAEGNQLTFVSSFPVLLSGGQIITFTALERFADPYGAVLDENGTAVSEILTDAELVWNLNGSGKATSAVLSVDSEEDHRLTVALRVAFDTPVAAETFQNSTVALKALLTCPDGTISTLERNMAFTSIENDTVAVYTADIILPADVGEVTFTLGAEAIATDKTLYDRDYTVELSKALPECDELSITRPTAEEPIEPEPVPGTDDRLPVFTLSLLALLMVLAVLVLRRKTRT